MEPVSGHFQTSKRVVSCGGRHFVLQCNHSFSKGKIPVLEVDLQGAIQLNDKKDLKPIFCFIKPPSYDELERRLKGRGTETPEKVAKRLRQAKVHPKF